jgi:NAD(P)-dependent dehydrogenase (short-subunit alcohol dehydrogenase family)
MRLQLPHLAQLKRGPLPGWTVQDVPDQRGVSAVITGANSGIGLETARVLARRGARVVMAVRDPIKGEAALADLRHDNPDADLAMGLLDLADLSSVHRFVEWMKAEDLPVGILINNGGVMAVPRSTTVDGFELQIATNHLGHFALTGLLLGRLLEHDDARVVTVTSIAHRRGHIAFDDLMSTRSYGRQDAYRQSKLANLLFAKELQRRMRRAHKTGIRSVAAHPGLAHTNLATHLTEDSRLSRVAELAERVASRYIQTAADGALPILRAATDPLSEGGALYGPAGRGQLRGPAIEVKPKASALEVHDARALWERSVDLTGVPYTTLDW